MKRFVAVMLFAILLVSIGCANNPTGDRVPDVNKTLVAKIAVTGSDSVLIDQAIVFSGELSKAPEGDPIAKYEWHFGDGSSATGRMAQHKYVAAGGYSVKLRVTTASGLSDSTAKTMVIVDHFEKQTPTLYLISSEKKTDGSYIYRMAALKTAIKGNRSAPFHTGDYNGWKAVAMEDSTSDYYLYSITTFDGEIKLTFGGQYPNSWAIIKYSAYYVTASDALVIIFKAGKIYKKGEVVVDQIPGDTGDAVVRFSVEGNNLTIYFNNREKIAGVKDQPFWVSVIGGWTKPQTQFLVGSTGWGYASIPIGDLPTGSVLDFKFGGNFTSNSWATIFESYFYDAKKVCLSIKLVKVDASAKIAGAKPGALWTVVPAK